MKRSLLLFLLFPVLLTGCRKREIARSELVVTGIDITCTANNQEYLFSYRQNQKIEAVLSYLRIAKCRGTPELQPEYLPGEVYQIKVLLSDGTSRIHLQKADRYLRRHGSRWEKLEPNWGKYLGLLIKLMPQDS
jgi:hypothetical protein